MDKNTKTDNDSRDQGMAEEKKGRYAKQETSKHTYKRSRISLTI
jgi:hypothetical protein